MDKIMQANIDSAQKSFTSFTGISRPLNEGVLRAGLYLIERECQCNIKYKQQVQQTLLSVVQRTNAHLAIRYAIYCAMEAAIKIPRESDSYRAAQIADMMDALCQFISPLAFETLVTTFHRGLSLISALLDIPGSSATVSSQGVGR